MRYAVAAAVALVLTGCTIPPPPKSGDEFRAAVLKGATFTKYETLDINRDFSNVIFDVRRNAEKCLSVTTISSAGFGLNVSTTRSTYRPEVAMKTPNKAQFTLQVVWAPKPVGTEQPAGGYYQMVADIDRVGPKTKLATYGITGGPANQAYQAIKEWAEGKNTPCPDMK